MKAKSILSVKAIVEIAVFAAIGYVLDFCAGAYSAPLFINGGSIGIALLAVFLVSFRRGPLAGVLTGLIMGLLDLADGFYAIPGNFWNAFAQVALDYWLAYPLAGLAGVFRYCMKREDPRWKRVLFVLLGALLGGTLKFLSHYLAGVLFWGDDASSFAWDLSWMNKWFYSFVYNIAYMGPCIVLSGGLMALIAAVYPKFLFVEDTGISALAKENQTSEVK